MTLLLILLVVVLLVGGGGYYWGGPGPGIGLAGILAIILIALLLTGRLGHF